MDLEKFRERLKNTTHPTVMIHGIESIEIEVEEEDKASNSPTLVIEYNTINEDKGFLYLFFNKGEHIKKNIHAEVSKVQNMAKFKKFLRFISNITRKYAKTKKEE